MLLPGRYRIMPSWLPLAAAVVMLTPMMIGAFVQKNGGWLRVERAIMFAAISFFILVNFFTLFDVINSMLHSPRNIHGLALLSTSVAIWVVNVLLFSLLYWLIDRGGPEARAGRIAARYPDFSFPQMSDPSNAPPEWMPSFGDYLFIGFTAQTAFSPTDAMPLALRAKSLMMVQGLISLITLVIVAARAINILY